MTGLVLANIPDINPLSQSISQNVTVLGGYGY
jgi:hypothetical protein